MGATCCKGDTVQNTDKELNKQRTLQDDFFDKYPSIQETLALAVVPQNWKFDLSLSTPIKKQGTFLGKRNVLTRNGYGIMLYESSQVENEALYYIGYWHNNSKQGMGIMVDKYGSYYKGQWYNDEPNGYGEYFDTKNQRYYKGKWKNGKKEGQGEQGFPDGTKYVGNYKDDKKHGFGKLVFREKDCFFEGQFKEDKIMGKGKQRGTNFQYDGPWEDGLMQGAGRSTYFNDSNRVEDVFVGQFNKGVKNGYGEYRWADGSIYKGQWREGSIVNRGVFIQKD